MVRRPIPSFMHFVEAGWAYIAQATRLDTPNYLGYTLGLCPTSDVDAHQESKRFHHKSAGSVYCSLGIRRGNVMWDDRLMTLWSLIYTEIPGQTQGRSPASYSRLQAIQMIEDELVRRREDGRSGNGTRCLELRLGWLYSTLEGGVADGLPMRLSYAPNVVDNLDANMFLNYLDELPDLGVLTASPRYMSSVLHRFICCWTGLDRTMLSLRPGTATIAIPYAGNGNIHFRSLRLPRWMRDVQMMVESGDTLSIRDLREAVARRLSRRPRA